MECYSPYLFTFYEIIVTPNNLIFVEPLAENGNMQLLFDNMRISNNVIDERQIWIFFIQIVDAIYFLHKHNIIHRDIKPENILLDKMFTIIINDFNSCKIENTINRYQSTIIGTPLYMAPEMLNGEYYGKSIDIWGLGCILYEMIEGQPPFMYSNNMVNLYKKILSLQIEPIKRNDISKHCKQWVNKLLKKRFRPTIETIRKSINAKALYYDIKLIEPIISKNLHSKNVCSSWKELINRVETYSITKPTDYESNISSNKTLQLHDCLEISKKNIYYKNKI
jgi:serine/threonine protein kinase